VDERDPLHELQSALNLMATQLAAGREELRQRIAQATRELRDRTEEAEAATLAKSRFLAAASHDLRQPLHALGMFIARFGQLHLDVESRALVANLEASVHSMQDLMDGLLDLSRLEGGTVHVQMQPINLSVLTQSLAQSIRPTVDNKRLRLRLRCADHWVLSDPVLLHRILLNLVNNAVRYTETGSVLVACRSIEGGSRIQIQVWDSGIGISAEHQQNIFKEFYQVANAGRNRTLGLGLGLNIVERSAKLLDHPVHLCSVLGRGTRVTITVLCCTPPAERDLVMQEQEGSAESALDARILLIEDDKLAREALRDLLASWNYRVVAVAGSEDALGFVRTQGVPDAIISDFRLGGTENGLGTIEAIRALAKVHVPACVMSGDTDAGLMLAAKEAGLTLLHKPVRPAKLRSLLRHLVQG
jgi:signal transduction histidine kinase